MLKTLCVKAVESTWLGGVKLVCLTHSQPNMKTPMGKSRRVAPMFYCDVPHANPQALRAFNSYVFNFSSLTTGLIRINTKYIN